MRKLSVGMALSVICLILIYVVVFYQVSEKHKGAVAKQLELQSLVGALGITDLVISTEARYTRHLTVSDSVVISMDHPGAIEHFPSSAFFAPSIDK